MSIPTTLIETIGRLLERDDDLCYEAAAHLIALSGTVKNLTYDLRCIRRKFPTTRIFKPGPDDPFVGGERAQSGIEDPDATYDVERILGHTVFRGRIFYLVKWLGYDEPTLTALLF